MNAREYRSGWAAYCAGSERDGSKSVDWLQGWDDAHKIGAHE